MSIGRGKSAELAVKHAARIYRTEGRCALVRQEPPISRGPDGAVMFSGTAAIDFVGCYGKDQGARALCIEVKSTHKPSWPCDELRPDQRAALEAFHVLGADCKLLVAFEAANETYLFNWPDVSDFVANGWRASISLTFGRAVGLVVPELHRGDASRRVARFLDAVPHVDAAAARVALAEERERYLARPAKQEEIALPPAPYVAPSEEERRARIIAATNEGIARQLKRAGQAQRFGRGRR